jgi:7-carboxy-7-deazaguanine synthase
MVRTGSPESTLIVNEIFGPTWQGEGRDSGQLASFVRLGTCNQSCVWCDTPYAVFYTERKASKHEDGKLYDPNIENTRMTVSEIMDAVGGISMPSSGIVVISGGEPMLQDIGPLVQDLLCDYGVAVETAGTIWRDIPGQHLIQWNVSPKLQTSGNPLHVRYRPRIIDKFVSAGADFKFVITCERDLDEVDSMVRLHNIPLSRIWVMPEGRTPEQVTVKIPWLAARALERKWNFTLRSHLLIFGTERGH